MTPTAAVAMLDRQLAAHGETVIVRRGATDITCKAMVRALSGQEIRPGSNSTQLTGRAILSPTGLAALLPLRTTDKLVRGNQERAIGWADNKRMADTYVRITVDFAG